MKKSFTVLVMLVAVLFTGCSFNVGIDTMLAPPKLSEQHEQIYKALVSAEGSDINLKYPKSGTNLSAFTVADIDGDNSDEAIVFYENESISAEDSSLRINVLDQKNGKWYSVYDYSAEGTDVERIIVSKLGESDIYNIIIGYGMVNPGEKHVIVYNYINSKLTPTLDEAYSIIDVRDIDKDDMNELFILSAVSNQTAPEAIQNTVSQTSAQILKLDSSGIYHQSSVNLNPNILEFKQLSYGLIDNTKTGIYIDEAVGANDLRTEILTFEDGILKIIYGNGSSVMESNPQQFRPISNKTMDIDGDGLLDIPVNETFSGYKDYPDTEKLYMTEWFTFEEGMLAKKYESYYSITDGYSFMFPKRWQGQVTVKLDSINEEVVICKFSGEITDNMTELMRIAVVDKSLAEDKTNEGYQLMHSKGETEYLVWIPKDIDEPLVPTISEVMFNLMFIE